MRFTGSAELILMVPSSIKRRTRPNSPCLMNRKSVGSSSTYSESTHKRAGCQKKRARAGVLGAVPDLFFPVLVVELLELYAVIQDLIHLLDETPEVVVMNEAFKPHNRVDFRLSCRPAPLLLFEDSCL